MSFSSLQKTAFLFLAGILVAGLLPFSFVRAQTLDARSLIDLFQKQIAALQEQITSLQNSSSGSTNAPDTTLQNIVLFSVYLEKGVSGQEVKNLQQVLSGFSDIYPEKIISGYFGLLTEKAVKRFQQKYGIDALGVVGPRTRAKLNELILQEKSKTLPVSSGGPVPRTVESPSVVTPATSTPIAALPFYNSQFLIEPRPPYDIDDLAQRIHALVNEKRKENGLVPLAWDWQLAQVAFLHSSDQARDNEETTNPDIICSYPIIRHEGFLFGFSLKERFDNKNIQYRAGGENIGILPASKNLTYQYPQDNPPLPCPDVPVFEVAEGQKEERVALYESILKQSIDAALAQKPVMWVNRSWYEPQEIALRIVDGWMGSPGHRANILTPEFEFGGIGVAPVNDYFIITHDFVDR